MSETERVELTNDQRRYCNELSMVMAGEIVNKAQIQANFILQQATDMAATERIVKDVD